jgi:TRAP-type transport system small permease protein
MTPNAPAKSAVARLAAGATRLLELTIVACLTVMAILVFGNVVLRYGFDSGIAVSEELSRLLFVWLVFLGAILASRQHAHIGFDTLVGKLPSAMKKTALAMSGGLMLVACVIFVVGGWQQTQINLDNSYPVLGISYGWLYGSAMVFGVGMICSITLNLWEALTQPNTGEELVMTLNLGDRIEHSMQSVATGKSRSEPS